MITIDEIQKNIREVFEKYNIKVLTFRLDPNSRNKYAEDISKKLDVDDDPLIENLNDLFYTVGSAQLEIGLMLISKFSAQNPEGITKKLFDNDSPLQFKLGNMHFWHHYYLTWECIYRVWERLTDFICIITDYKTEDKKYYFNVLLNEIKKDKRFSTLKTKRNLVGLSKHWNKVAKLRNGFSHSRSPLSTSNISVKKTSILNSKGLPLVYVEQTMPNLIEKGKEVIQEYEYLEKAIDAVIIFINEYLGFTQY